MRREGRARKSKAYRNVEQILSAIHCSANFTGNLDVRLHSG